MSSPRTFHTGLLGRDMHVAVTPKQWRRLRKRFDDCLTEDPQLARTELIEHPSGPSFTVVVYVDRERVAHEASTVEVVAHEAAHVARFILDGIGETGRTHEVEPYLVGWAARHIWEALQ